MSFMFIAHKIILWLLYKIKKLQTYYRLDKMYYNISDKPRAAKTVEIDRKF
jgi:hypothetical protein